MRNWIVAMACGTMEPTVPLMTCPVEEPVSTETIFMSLLLFICSDANVQITYAASTGGILPVCGGNRDARGGRNLRVLQQPSKLLTQPRERRILP